MAQQVSAQPTFGLNFALVGASNGRTGFTGTIASSSSRDLYKKTF